MHFNREITKKIEKHLFQGKVIIIYGPRRVGKTTLVQAFVNQYQSTKKTLFLVIEIACSL